MAFWCTSLPNKAVGCLIWILITYSMTLETLYFLITMSLFRNMSFYFDNNANEAFGTSWLEITVFDNYDH